MSRAPFRFVVLASLVGCGAEAPQAAPTGPTPDGAVAMVAGKPIHRAAVVAVMREKHVSAREAVDALAFDARAAKIAEDAGFGDAHSVRSELRARLARALLEDLKARADEGAPRPEEIARIRKDHWMEVDRPEGRRTVHVVVVADEKSGEKREKAKAIAQKVWDKVKAATDEASFQKIAEAIPEEGGIEVKFESLPAVAKDARVVTPPGGAFDPAFATAVWSLEKVGDVSQPFSTSFGWHVAMVVEKLPAMRPSDEELLAVAMPEILANRGADALGAVLAQRKKDAPPEIPRNVDEVLRGVDPLTKSAPP